MTADYTAEVYAYLRTLGDPGDEVRTAISPFLVQRFGLTSRQAQHYRAVAMRELTRSGRVQRLNTRGRYLRICS